MRTIKLTQDVIAYPQGAKEGSVAKTYYTGDQDEVSNDFADMMVEKGHARYVDEPAPAPSEARAAPAKSDEADSGETKRGTRRSTQG